MSTLETPNRSVSDLCISDKRLPKRENLDFQISCLYIDLPAVFFSFLIYLSILIKAKSFTNDFAEWFALWTLQIHILRKMCVSTSSSDHHSQVILAWHLSFLRNCDTPSPLSAIKSSWMTSLPPAFLILDQERTPNIQWKSWRRIMKTADR